MYTENSALLNAQTRISPHPVLSSPQPQSQTQQPQSAPQPEKLEKPAIPLAVKRQMAPPPRQRRSSFRISNASPQQQQPQQPPQQPPLNPESHHVRTTNQKQKSIGKKPQQQQQQWDEEDSDEQHRPVEFAVLERRLIESIEIEESLKLCVNGRIADAISLGLLRVPILAFMITHSDGCQFVTDFRLLCRRYEVELLGLPESLSIKNLSVDMFHYEKEFTRIVSLLVYLTDLRPAKKFVISRQPIAITPHALEIWPEDETGGTQSLQQQQQQQQQMTMTITTTTTTTMTASRHSDNSSNVMTMSRSNTGDMTIPNQTPLSAFERFFLNCMRMRQTGHYYMIYVDLGLTLYDQSVQRGSSTVSCKNGNSNR
jgi:hypothetical protein